MIRKPKEFYIAPQHYLTSNFNNSQTHTDHKSGFVKCRNAPFTEDLEMNELNKLAMPRTCDTELLDRANQRAN